MNPIGESLAGGWLGRRFRLERIVRSPYVRNVIGFCLFEVAFYFAYRFGMSFSQATASPFWFPDSGLLCALLLSRPQRWWLFVLGPLPIRLFAEVAQDLPLWFLLTTFAVDSAKGLVTAAALRRFVRDAARLETVRDFGFFCFFAVLLVPAVSAFGGAAARQALGHDYWRAWEEWFMGDALAQLVITPAILHWLLGVRGKMQMPSARRGLEGGVLAAGLILTGYVALNAGPGGTGFAEPRFFAPVPFLFWAAVRFGMLGASSAIMVFAFLSVQAALAGRGPFSGQASADTALALQYFLLLRAAPMYLVAILIDQRKADEFSLRASEQRYREVVETQTDLVCRYQSDTTLTFVNEAYCRFFNRSREQLMGLKFLELIPAASRPGVLKNICMITNTRRTVVLEHEVLLPDGTVGWHHWVNHAILDAHNQVVELQAIGRDITDRKRAEEARQSLAHASRLAAVGECTAMIAHELNQPLGAIRCNAEAAEMLLDQRTVPLDQIREILVDIRKDDLRASETIGRIRALLRRREMEMQVLDLNETVVHVLRLADGDAHRRGVQIHRALATPLPLVRGDRVHLQHVLLNLVLNGMEAMNENADSQRHLFVSTACGEGAVEVTVGDVGHGIAPENLPRVFDSFFTTKRDGMGLGLSIARSIVQLHAGRIWAENNADGKGATFHFSVPICGETQSSDNEENMRRAEKSVTQAEQWP